MSARSLRWSATDREIASLAIPALGALVGLQWSVGLLVIGTWLVMAALFRISSLSALIAAGLAPVYMWWLKPEPAFIIASILMTALLIFRHRSNIRNLLDGTEGKISFGSKKSEQP